MITTHNVNDEMAGLIGLSQNINAVQICETIYSISSRFSSPFTHYSKPK